ncbi:hypothetical protein EV702DRAFT_1092980 [Suillus placidus]|uniref:Uncharacterized protein n=1 Tax=Suillus placidus TaxID=48579 RepID=A0A9P6ZY25_9AGAM|nr:hypothetical protein EV702DRAFT_1092980 [Suillus placidus]
MTTSGACSSQVATLRWSYFAVAMLMPTLIPSCLLPWLAIPLRCPVSVTSSYEQPFEASRPLFRVGFENFTWYLRVIYVLCFVTMPHDMHRVTAQHRCHFHLALDQFRMYSIVWDIPVDIYEPLAFQGLP